MSEGPRYLRRHAARVIQYLQSGKPKPRRVRREQQRILRMGKKAGVI